MLNQAKSSCGYELENKTVYREESSKKRRSNHFAVCCSGAIILFVTMVVVGCLSGPPDSDEISLSSTSKYEIYNSVQVSRAQLGSKWPFTVDSGSIECYKFNTGARAWFFKTPSGISYPVNGIAKGAARNFRINNRDVYQIWANDPESYQGAAKVYIGNFIDKGNQICGTD